MSDILQAPDRVVAPDGRPRYGAFRGAVQDSSLDGLTTVSRWQRAVGQKRWIYFAVFSEQLMAGGCVVDLTYLLSGFAFAFFREDQTLVDHHRMGPRLLQVVPDTPTVGTARFTRPGGVGGELVELVSDASTHGAGRRWLRARLGQGDQRLELELELRDDSQQVTPLSAVTELPGGRLDFTHKVVGLPATGRVTAGGRTVELRDALAAVDYTHALPEHHTDWRWACGAGHADSGEVLGLNLVHGWNARQVQENAAWLGGELILLGPARIDIGDHWELSAEGQDARLQARFFPEGERRQDVNLKLIASRYVQPFGRFEGTLERGGSTTRFEALGVTEDHEARW